MDSSERVTISTQMSVSGQGNDWRGSLQRADIRILSQSARPQKCLSAGGKIHVVDTRIANRTITAIQVISCLATVIVTGLILTMVGTSIYGILVTVR